MLIQLLKHHQELYENLLNVIINLILFLMIFIRVKLIKMMRYVMLQLILIFR